MKLVSHAAGSSAIAAAFLPRAEECGQRGGAEAGGLAEDLYVVAAEGLLTRHRLRLNPLENPGDDVFGSSYGSAPESTAR